MALLGKFFKDRWVRDHDGLRNKRSEEKNLAGFSDGTKDKDEEGKEDYPDSDLHFEQPDGNKVKYAIIWNNVFSFYHFYSSLSHFCVDFILVLSLSISNCFLRFLVHIFHIS